MRWPPPVSLKDNRDWWDLFWTDELAKGFGKPSKSLLKFIPPPRLGATAIDIASGNGRYAIELAKLGYLTTVLELTDAGLNGISQLAKARGLEIASMQGDFIELRNEKYCYDLIVCSGLLEEIPKSSHKQVVTGFLNWTKPGGLVISRYCLEIVGRGILVDDDATIKYFSPESWDIVFYKELKEIKPSKGGFDIRHGTIIAQRKK